MKTSAIILAAGLSRRMKQDKLFLTISGTPMVEKVWQRVQQAGFDEIILVTNDHYEGFLKNTLEGPNKFVLNPSPKDGIASSIRLGLLAADPDSQAFAFFMADQPFLKTETIRQLKETFCRNPNKILIPTNKGKNGAPVFFPAHLKGELLALSGDVGGKKVIQAHPELVHKMDVPDAVELFDIDTPEEYAKMGKGLRCLVRGGGDLASGVIRELKRQGHEVVVCEVSNPSCIRTKVSFATALREGSMTIDGITAIPVDHIEAMEKALEKGLVPILVDPKLERLHDIRPQVLVDVILAKRNLGTFMDMAPLVIALGPGFTAGVDCHIAIETMRGKDLGKILRHGSPLANTGVPGLIFGESTRRVIHSPGEGTMKHLKAIGDIVEGDEIIAFVGSLPVRSKIRGLIRGLIYDGFPVTKGLKIADVDPRLDPALAWTISDKAKLLGRSVVQAIEEHNFQKTGLNPPMPLTSLL